MAEKSSVAIIAVIVGVLALSIGLLVSSLKKVNSDEVGIAYNTVQKILYEDTKDEGLHTGPPGFEIIIFPSVFKSINFTSLKCLNKDGVKILLDVSFQYQARAAHLRKLILQFRDHKGYLKVLVSVGNSVIHESCSKFNTTQFQAERAQFQDYLRKRLRLRYDDLYADVTDLQVNNIARPAGYETAVRAKESAREDIKVAINEKPRKLTQAKTVLKEAETQAAITVQKAEADATIIKNKAQTEAEAIKNRYEKEAETYKKLVDAGGLNLGTEGFLSYIGVRAISSATNPVYVSMKGPAKTSYLTP